MTDVTILMPTFNRAASLRTTLQVLCQLQLGELSVDVIVIDNGSTDGTPGVLQEFAHRLPLRVLCEPEAGKSNALNRALRDAPLGELVVFMDDDVTPSSDWLQVIVAACQRWPDHSVFGGRIDPGWPRDVPVPFWASDQRVQAIAFSAHHPRNDEGPYPNDFEPFGPNFWVRRSALQTARFRSDLGPHPTRRTLGDESEFLRQLRRQGHCPIHVPSARVVHRIEPERTTPAAVYRRAYQSGRGTVHVSGLPEHSLLMRSPAGWHLRIAANVGVAACQLLGAALEPDERLRFSKLFNRTYTLSRNLEALRWATRRCLHSLAVSVAQGSRPALGPGRANTAAQALATPQLGRTA